MPPSPPFVAWPRLEVRNRAVPGWGWMFCLEMQHPNPGPHELSVVHANGLTFDSAINHLRDYVDDWNARHSDVS